MIDTPQRRILALCHKAAVIICDQFSRAVISVITMTLQTAECNFDMKVADRQLATWSSTSAHLTSVYQHSGAVWVTHGVLLTAE